MGGVAIADNAGVRSRAPPPRGLRETAARPREVALWFGIDLLANPALGTRFLLVAAASEGVLIATVDRVGAIGWLIGPGSVSLRILRRQIRDVA